MAPRTTFTLEIVTPDRALIREDVDEVVVPGSDGDLGVLPGHGGNAFSIVRQSRTAIPLPGADIQPRRTRAESALSRLRSRRHLVVRQSAAAPPDLLVRVHGRDARDASSGTRAVRALHVLR